MRRFGLLGVLAVVLLAVIAGAIGYNLGIGANVAAAGAPVAYPVYGWGFGFGFPLFGLFFFLIFIFVIFGIVRRLAWGAGHRGHGRGGRSWERRDIPPFADEMLQRWHSEAHAASESGERPGLRTPAG